MVLPQVVVWALVHAQGQVQRLAAKAKFLPDQGGLFVQVSEVLQKALALVQEVVQESVLVEQLVVEVIFVEVVMYQPLEQQPLLVLATPFHDCGIFLHHHESASSFIHLRNEYVQVQQSLLNRNRLHPHQQLLLDVRANVHHLRDDDDDVHGQTPLYYLMLQFIHYLYQVHLQLQPRLQQLVIGFIRTNQL